MRRNQRLVPVAIGSIGAFILAAGGCESPERRDSAQYPVRDTTRATGKSSTQAAAQRGQVFGISEMTFPTGDEGSSLVRVTTHSTQDQVRVGQPFIYKLEVTNLSKDLSLEDVAIHQDLPQNMEIAGVNPEGIQRGESPGTFVVGQLSPGQSKAFEVALVPQEPGNFETCVRVTYNPVLCTSISVVAPELRLVKEAPRQVLLCDPIPVRYIITNTGTGSTEPVVIREQLPEGITGPNGSRNIEIAVGPLQSGQTREFTVNLQAQRPGELTSPAIARSEGGLEAQAEAAPILIYAPQLELQLQAPEQVFTGRPIQYRAMVTNRGNGPANDTVLNLNLPQNVRLVSSTIPTRQGAGAINIGQIPPGESREFEFAVETGSMGPLEINADVRAHCANQVQQQIVTNVRGVTSLLLEVVDNNDPIQVGQRERYQIGVANQGSIADRDVQIRVLVPEGFEILDATGPTRAQIEGNQITFEPLGVLEAKQRVVWEVAIRALRAGDYRFRTELTSSTLTEPVIESEATRAY